jgi:hypothetical protein
MCICECRDQFVPPFPPAGGSDRTFGTSLTVYRNCVFLKKSEFIVDKACLICEAILNYQKSQGLNQVTPHAVLREITQNFPGEWGVK